jgi:hypothetical protein
MLPGSSFRDDPGFAHALREEDLSNAIIDFVGARMKQVLAFKINPGTA